MAAGTNLVVNGSFEQPVTGMVDYPPSVPGWQLSGGIAIEFQRIPGQPYAGEQLVELDSLGVSGIYQDIPTEAGKTYKLTFAFSPRPSVSENKLNVSWGNASVAKLEKSGEGLSNTDWQVYTYELKATSNNTRLSFDNLNETSDELGTFIDAVSVEEKLTTPSIKEPDEPCVSGSIISLVDFETLPSGGTPTDDLEFNDTYNYGETKVTFGFDSNHDLTIDVPARFESRLPDPGRRDYYGYTHRRKNDVDLTATQEGGNWFLRNLWKPAETKLMYPYDNNGEFLAVMDGKLGNSASGQIWDADLGEEYTIDAIDQDGNVMDSITTGRLSNNEGAGTYSGLPFPFSFDSLPRPIKVIRISGRATGRGRGFAFDNFSATDVCPK
ncbi:DUF642 domain-containing protein [Okeania sp. SIO2B3]|uniref:DUF642 domain-containing protein n=1 Tax=Okeania sp. SIO2B3 TaxID=2607784 RepID=UPI0013BF5EDF|nr:DUF642 domain-containing protein [Okeania sp. SIO2B3]NET42486.1 DUF642 domain-containing protein [Okeania sp. SIO2B3]